MNKRFNLKDMIRNVRYLILDPVGGIRKVDQIVASSNRLFVLDSIQKIIVCFNLKGKYLYRIHLPKIRNFEVFNDEIMYYNIEKGIVQVFDTSGEMKSTVKIGLRGIEFRKLRSLNYVFYTGGLSTSDHGSSDYELSFIAKDLSHSHFELRLPESKINLKYISQSRFASSGNNILFIPSFSNTVYQVDKNSVHPLYEFKFGRSTLTEDKFKTYNNVRDYNQFPYIIDLSVISFTEKATFFSFTIKGRLGYLLLDNRSRSVLACGVGSVSGNATFYNDVIPLTNYKNSFICLASSTNIASHDNIKMDKIYRQKINKLVIGDFQATQSNNIILMFYDLG